MIDPIITYFDKLVDQFTWRRLVFTICVIAILVGCLFGYESYTGHFRLERIEKEAYLLDKLIAQGANISTNANPEIVNIHKALIKEMGLSTNPQQDNHVAWYVKMFWAALPWIFAVFMIRLTSGKIEKSTLGGVFLFMIPVCVGSIMLPTFERTWINYFAFPWICFLSIAFLLVQFGNKANRAAVSPPKNVP